MGKTKDLTEQIRANLRRRGFLMSTGKIEQLRDLKHDIERLYRDGLISSEFFQERLSHFNFSPSAEGTKLVYFIVTAAPQSQQGIIFNYQDREYYYAVPPTYSLKTDRIIEKIIHNTLTPLGFSIFPMSIPLKLAAVRTGLAKYGRNNITYCNGIGSYYRLKAFATDLPLHQDRWQEPELMPQCEHCTACLKVCPTKAITEKRILLHADKCLTYHNERLNDFPEWIDRSWHHCLIGCMLCQTACPENRKLDIQPETMLHFSEEETEALINARHKNELPESVAHKLGELSLLEDWPLISRNLRVILSRHDEPQYS